MGAGFFTDSKPFCDENRDFCQFYNFPKFSQFRRGVGFVDAKRESSSGIIVRRFFDKTESSLFEEVFGRGETLFNLRARYEFADQSDLQASHAAPVPLRDRSICRET